ncbi:MAG: hypothetical protein ACLSGS_04340 [Adlercreutzia sp.]
MPLRGVHRGAGAQGRGGHALERSIGNRHIGAGESQAMTLIAQAMDEVRRTPAVDFAIHSGTTAELKDGLVRGSTT